MLRLMICERMMRVWPIRNPMKITFSRLEFLMVQGCCHFLENLENSGNSANPEKVGKKSGNSKKRIGEVRKF